jgi:Uma2 family endonuclease
MTTLDILPEVTCPPTDLWSDEPLLESDLHLQQIIILLNCLELLWQEKNDYYASGNLTIYYSVFQSAEVQKLWVLGKRQEAKGKGQRGRKTGVPH